MDSTVASSKSAVELKKQNKTQCWSVVPSKWRLVIGSKEFRTLWIICPLFLFEKAEVCDARLSLRYLLLPTYC